MSNEEKNSEEKPVFDIVGFATDEDGNRVDLGEIPEEIIAEMRETIIREHPQLQDVDFGINIKESIDDTIEQAISQVRFGGVMDERLSLDLSVGEAMYLHHLITERHDELSGLADTLSGDEREELAQEGIANEMVMVKLIKALGIYRDALEKELNENFVGDVEEWLRSQD